MNENTAQMEARYVDLKQIIEAIIGHLDPETVADNYTAQSLIGEMNFLAEILNYEDIDAMIERLVGLNNKQ